MSVTCNWGLPMDPSLHHKHLAAAYSQASRSLDPSTQNGAVLLDYYGNRIGYGYNRFPAGVAATEDRLADRAQKYHRTIHAEVDAILDAVNRGHGNRIKGGTLYACWCACGPCAAVIAQAGIAMVVGDGNHPGVRDPAGRWFASVAIGLETLREVGTIVHHYEHDNPFGCTPIRFDGTYWTP